MEQQSSTQGAAPGRSASGIILVAADQPHHLQVVHHQSTDGGGSTQWLEPQASDDHHHQHLHHHHHHNHHHHHLQLGPAATSTSTSASAASGQARGHVEEADPAWVFSQDEHHEDLVVHDEDDNTNEAKRAEITKTFFQAFFDYPVQPDAIQEAQEYQVLVDEIDFLYDNVVPLRLRQRKQERSKYRLNELRDALQRAASADDAGSSGSATGILLPPPPPVMVATMGIDEVNHLHQQLQHLQQQQMLSDQAKAPARKKRKVEFEKKSWMRRERGRCFWLGMRGPFFPAHSSSGSEGGLNALHKLEKLVGRSFPNLNEHTFRASWDHEHSRRQQAATLLLSNPKPVVPKGTVATTTSGQGSSSALPPSSSSSSSVSSPTAPTLPATATKADVDFPVYDMWRDGDQGDANPHAPNSFVHLLFDVPGVDEEPKFSFSRATRKWQLEGVRSAPVGLVYMTQQRPAGRFVARGMLPNCVDVSVPAKTSFANGLYHVTLTEHPPDS